MPALPFLNRDFCLWFAVPLAVFIITIIITKLLIVWAPKLGYNDLPNHHKLHKTPTPLLGGLAIFTTVILASLIYSRQGYFSLTFLVVLIPAFILGIIDDKIALNPYPKLCGFIVISLTPFVFSNYSLLAIFFLVGAIFFFTNSLNLVDNSDGHCGAIAISICIASLIIDPHPLKICAILAILGFLLFNWHQAKIFLGDAGSLFLGAFCVLAAFTNFELNHPLSLQALPIFCVAIYDTLSVIIIRIHQGRSIMIGGTDHTSHRLMRSGLSLISVNIIFAIFTILVGLRAKYSDTPFTLLAIGLIFLMVFEAVLNHLSSER